MTDEQRPITPTRIIPAGQTMPRPPVHPEPAAPPPPPPAPPTVPPAEPPRASGPDWGPPPDPGPIEVRVVLVPAELPPEPSRTARIWAWLTDLIRPWQLIVALVAALIPMWPVSPYSAATTWAYTVQEARDLHVAVAYGLGFGTFALAALHVIKKGSTIAVFFLVVTFIGIFGAIDWYDPIQWLTGVRR